MKAFHQDAAMRDASVAIFGQIAAFKGDIPAIGPGRRDLVFAIVGSQFQRWVSWISASNTQIPRLRCGVDQTDHVKHGRVGLAFTERNVPTTPSLQG